MCEKQLSCDPSLDSAECLANCAQSQEFMRPNIFLATTRCVLDLECNSDQANDCMEAALALAPADAADRIVTDMCTAMVRCGEGQIDMTQCLGYFEDELGEAMTYLGILKDSVIDCLGNCLRALSCEELQSEDAGESCAVTCGVADFT